MPAETVLAIDTAMNACSVAVQGSDHGFSKSEPMARGQAEVLVPMIEDVLKGVAIEYSALDAVLVTAGPGAFTGLRVGLSTAKSLGLSLDIPVYGITTLKALALQYLAKNKLEGVLAVIIETKRDDFYAQFFDMTGAEISGPLATGANEIVRHIDGPTVFIGDALTRFQEVSGETSARFIEGYERCDVEALARSFIDGKVLDSFFEPAEPVYLRGADVSQSKKIQRKLA